MVKRLFIITQVLIFMIFALTITYSQVIANFSADDTLGCDPLTVHFTNTSTGSNIIYKWYFGDIDTLYTKNPTFTFSNPGGLEKIFPVTLIVIDTLHHDTASLTKNITVLLKPSAKLDIDTSNSCVNGDVIFHTGFDPKDSVLWKFGDGTIRRESNEYISQDVYHAYPANGPYNMHYFTFLKICSDTSEYLINIHGPIAGFTMSSSDTCTDSQIKYTMTPISGVTSFSWDFGDGHSSTENPAYNHYNLGSSYVTTLFVSGPLGNCIIDDTIIIEEVIAGFKYMDNHFCDSQYVSIQDTSIGKVTHRLWEFGNDSTGTGSVSAQLYSPGSYIIKLKVWNDLGCSDETQDTIKVNSLPTLGLSHDTIICVGRSIIINAYSNAQKILWTPGSSLNNPTIFSPTAIPDSTTKYYVTVTDTITGCSNYGKLIIFIQDENKPHDQPTLMLGRGDTICRGQSIVLSAISNAQRIVWIPGASLNDSTIFNPIAKPETTTLYKATVTDTTTKCRQSGHLKVEVEDQKEIDNLTVFAADTSIKIGEYDTLYIIDGLKRGLNYQWYSGDEQINCNICTPLIVQPLTTTDYKLTVTDSTFCFSPKDFYITINVNEEYLIFVPDAFTPNGDEINKEIKVDGWGIKKLIEFRIFNRWGTEVFYTDNIDQGWDGYYKNKLQSMDSYAYIVKIELYSNQIVMKKGTFSLIR